MNRLNFFRTLALAAGVLVYTGCSDDAASTNSFTPGPEPGSLAVRLSSSMADDGGVTFRLTGEGITNLRPAHDGIEIFPLEENGGWTVAALGVGLSGSVALFDVADVRMVDAYSATLVEVADEANDVRRDISGHTLGVSVVR